MGCAKIDIDRGIVTNIKEFNSGKGYGVDFYIQAESEEGTVYVQVAMYDEEAHLYYSKICIGDYVKVSGILKVKIYKKKDNSEGIALLIERPLEFQKIEKPTRKVKVDNSRYAKCIKCGKTFATKHPRQIYCEGCRANSRGIR